MTDEQTLLTQTGSDSGQEKTPTPYSMDHLKQGTALIFSHKTYKDTYLSERKGTNLDCQALETSFGNLGFEVVICKDYTVGQIKSKLREIAEVDYKDHNCLVVVVLTRGQSGILYAFDTSYKADEIRSYFTADKCPSLAGKPKMFFIQACQGNKLDRLRERTETDTQAAEPRRIPLHADFLMAYSNVPSTSGGSWFVQGLCSELGENATKCNLLMLLTSISQRRLESDTTNMTTHEQRRFVRITSMLTRLVQFIRV